MSTYIKQVPHADQPGLMVWEWLVTSGRGEFVGGGYCATKADAESDLAIFLEGLK